MAEKKHVNKTGQKATKTVAMKDGPKKQAKAEPRSRAATTKPAGRRTKPSDTSTGKATTFKLEAPEALNVFLAGCFNGWDPLATPLVRDEEGVWMCTLDIEPGEHQYRFIVDGEWQADPLNNMRCWNEFGTENCLLIVER